MIESFSPVESAKIIRQQLRQKLPKTKFSVRCQHHARENSINISWQDGYTPQQIKSVIFLSPKKMRVAVNFERTFSDYAQQQIDEYFIFDLKPIFMSECRKYRDFPRKYEPRYITMLAEQIDFHNLDWHADEFIFDIDIEAAQAYPSPFAAEQENLALDEKTSLHKIIKVKFCRSWHYHPKTFKFFGWRKNGQDFESWAFQD